VLDEADEAEAPRPSFRRRLAGWVSVAAHPFVLIPALVAVVTARSLPPREAAVVVALVVVGSILPMLWIIVRRVRSGAWTDHDVSVREQRTGMYPAALAISAATVLLLYLSGTARSVLQGTVAVFLLIALSSLINLRLKISLHTGFAAFTAVSLLSMSRPMGIAGAVIALAVAWSRLELRRHTFAEVVGGALLGAGIGAALLLWPI
jgi:membrane-associated phospholipid phosphatase